MGIGTGLGVASIAGSAIGAGASLAGSGAQAKAAQQGQQLSAQEQAAALAEQQREFNTTQTNAAPFLSAGTNAVNFLDKNAASLSAPYAGPAFKAPTLAEAQAQPGYQFALDTGSQALASKAAAQGDLLLSGQTGEALQNFGQQLGQQDYQQVFNNMLTQHNQAYNEYNQNQANTFNRYASIAGVGQQAAGQLGQLGQQNAATIANIDLTGGAQQIQALNNQGAATASGYAGVANSVNSGISGVEGALTLQQLIAMQQAQQAVP